MIDTRKQFYVMLSIWLSPWPIEGLWNLPADWPASSLLDLFLSWFLFLLSDWTALLWRRILKDENCLFSFFPPCQRAEYKSPLSVCDPQELASKNKWFLGKTILGVQHQAGWTSYLSQGRNSSFRFTLSVSWFGLCREVLSWSKLPGLLGCDVGLK